MLEGTWFHDRVGTRAQTITTWMGRTRRRPKCYCSLEQCTQNNENNFILDKAESDTSTGARNGDGFKNRASGGDVDRRSYHLTIPSNMERQWMGRVSMALGRHLELRLRKEMTSRDILWLPSRDFKFLDMKIEGSDRLQ